MAEVRLENVRKLYGRKVAVNEVSFTCQEGEFLSILGPTGAGKSTILKMIAGIEAVSSGSIYFNNRPVNDVSPQERNVSMAFESYNLYPHFTAYENIAFPLRSPKREMKSTPQEERRKVPRSPSFWGLTSCWKRSRSISVVGKNNASLWRGPWCGTRRCTCWMSPSPTLTPS